MRAVISSAIIASFLALAAGPAAAGTEWVLILDNSASMSDRSELWLNGKPTGRYSEAADPHRLAVIATLIFRSFLDPDDRLTILTFDTGVRRQGDQPKVGLFGTISNDPEKIRELAFNQPTYFTGPFKKAREILEASPLPNKRLLLLTDGAPPPVGDTLTTEDAKRLLGFQNGEPGFEILMLALAADDNTRAMQEAFLKPLGDMLQFDDPTGLVEGFTKAYADSIDSRPESGKLERGKSYSFRAPKYVSEVLIAVATVNRTGTFQTTLDAGGTQVQPVDGGDSGCQPPRTPCHAYQVYKVPKDPSSEQQWTLSLPKAGGPVAYGIILRYSLDAEILSMSEAKVGEAKEVIARISWQGQGFNDPKFFESDDFKATLILGDQEVPMELRPDDGSFAGTVTVQKPGPQKMVVRFQNRWLTLTAEKPFDAEAWLPLDLQVSPQPIDFGSWTGERTESERCVTLDFTGSTNADKVPLEIFAKDLPDGFRLKTPSKGSTIADNSAEICLVAPGCCDAASSEGKTPVMVIRGEHEHYHPGAVEVPLKFDVDPTPFITCWWRVIAGIIGGIIFLITVYGFVKPFDFDSQEVIKLASKESGLARAAGRRLRELPGGKRGFYRDAKVGFDGSGGAVKPGAGASLILKATKNDTAVVSKTTIEHKDPRTRKWAPIDAGDGPLYLRRGVVYRVGEFFFRLG